MKQLVLTKCEDCMYYAPNMKNVTGYCLKGYIYESGKDFQCFELRKDGPCRAWISRYVQNPQK